MLVKKGFIPLISGRFVLTKVRFLFLNLVLHYYFLIIHLLYNLYYVK